MLYDIYTPKKAVTDFKHEVILGLIEVIAKHELLKLKICSYNIISS